MITRQDHTNRFQARHQEKLKTYFLQYDAKEDREYLDDFMHPNNKLVQVIKAKTWKEAREQLRADRADWLA